MTVIKMAKIVKNMYIILILAIIVTVVVKFLL